MKKQISYSTIGCDLVAGFNDGNFFPQEILDKYEFVLNKKNPDFVFCSCFFQTLGEFTKYNDAVKIFFSGENVSPDFIFFDYWVGFDDIAFSDRYFQLPFCFWESEYTKDKNVNINEKKDYFCDFIYSHDDENHRREKVFKKLSEYKQVSSFGSFLNNSGIYVSKNNKSEIQSKCKFSLIIESCDTDGFITEKLIHALKAGTIPVFFGTNKVVKYFNNKRFINANDFSSLDEVIEEVKRIDNNDVLYKQMLNENIYANGFDLNILRANYIKFLEHIFDNTPIIRRDLQYSNARYFKALKRYSKFSLTRYPFKKLIKNILKK